MKFNGERGRPVARRQRLGANSRAPPPTLRSVDRDSRRRGRAACARPLTAEIHSRSTGFGDRLSTSVHELERNARSHVRLECATARSGAEDHERTRHSVAPPTLTIEIHSVASEFGHEISTPRYAAGSIADPRVPLECAAPRIPARCALDARKSAPGKPHPQSVADTHPSKAQHFSSFRARLSTPCIALTDGKHSVASDSGPGYPQPTPRRNVRPAHRQRRLMRLPSIGVECREVPPMLAPAIHSPFASTAFRVVGGPVVHIHLPAEEAVSHRHSVIDRMICAGFPPTSVSGGTSRITTESAPTTAFSPTVAPPPIVAPVRSHVVRPCWPA